MEIITVDDDDIDDARGLMLPVVQEWLRDGRFPSTLLVALVEIIDDIETQATAPVQ